MAKLDIKLVPTQMIATSLIDSNKGQIEGVKANPRVLRDDKFRKLKKSIQDNPDMMALRELMVYEHEGRYVTIGGNQRLEALRSLKIAEAPCKVIPADTTPEQLNAYIVLDNAPFGEWDWDALANEWDAADLSDWGVDFSEDWAGTTPTEEEKEAVEDDFDETRDEVPTICKDGDIWQLGEHRLMCGDSTDPGSVALLMNGEMADLWLTDPPYNVNYEGGTDDKLKIANDNQEDGEFRQFLVSAFKAAVSHLKRGGGYYIWHAGLEGYNFCYAVKEVGLSLKQCLIWNKNSLVMGRQDYQWKHEPCLYGWKEGDTHKWYSDRKQTTVIDCDRPLRNGDHPTMKPVALFAYLMQNSTKEGDVVLDTFAGSGTTVIAAEQLGRRARLCEIDPHYCDVIIARWEKLMGQKAQLLKNVNQPIENSRII